MASVRAFDGDEGFYAVAAKLVAHGKQPYFDFWFQYTPGLPYVYGTWTRFIGESFESLRSLSALLTILLGVVLFAHVAERSSRRLGVVAVVLYISSTLVFGWYSTYKSYVLSTLLLFVAYVLVAATDRGEQRSVSRWFAAGVFVGLSIDVRLLFVAAVPVFVYYAARATPLANVAALLGGVFAGVLPCSFFFVRDPHRFVADTLLSHTSRSDLSLWDSVVQKLDVVGHLLARPQVLVLVAAAVALAIHVLARRRRLPLALALAGALALVSILPTPSYAQYFSTLVPFLAVASIELWCSLRAALPRGSDRRLALVVRGAGAAALVFYVVAGASEFRGFLYSGDVRLDAPRVRVIRAAIDAHTRKGEVVIDFAPIDLYESHADPFPGMESNFGGFVAANLELSDAEAADYKLLTVRRLEQVVRSGTVRTIVLAPYEALLYPRPWKNVLAESGYRPVATVGDRTIYQRPQP
jgi:hypothetical protein